MVSRSIETLDQLKAIFRCPHDGAQIDGLDGAPQPQPTTTTAQTVDKTGLRQRLRDFHQMIAGDPIASRNFFNGMDSVWLQGEQHQQPEGIVRMAGETHGYGVL